MLLLFSPLLVSLLSLLPPATALNIIGAGNASDSTSGAQPYRTEINDFSQSGAAWDLYIQALAAFQARNEVAWDGVSGTGSYPGFCMHSSELFTTWHRPYLALVEQQIWAEAQTIAQSYPESSRSTYESAATSLRIPYWDTVANPELPAAVTSPSVEITTANGSQTIDNPLYNYTFQSDSASARGFPTGNALSSYQSTIRCWDGSASNQSASTANLQAGAASNLALTYRFFTTVSDFITFCTAATLPNQTDSSGTNIENVHNNIHNSVGGFGHMSDPTLAAFDPVFWLHHVNVDRQFAMWQALHPDSYVQDEVNGYGSYYEPEGTIDTLTTSLAPFHNTDDDSTMWTSEGIRSLSTFRYSYPELPYWSMNASELQTYVSSKVNELYNPDSSTSSRKRWTHPTSKTFNPSQAFSANNAERQWFARISLQKYTVATSYTILLFMGDPPADESQWTSASNLVGSMASFTAFDGSAIFPDGAPSGKTQGEIALTHALLSEISLGVIPDLQPDNVLPLLLTGLKWRVQTAEGKEISLDSLSDLSIDVGSRAVDPTTSASEFPVYASIDWHPCPAT